MHVHKNKKYVFRATSEHKSWALAHVAAVASDNTTTNGKQEALAPSGTVGTRGAGTYGH